jgi:hypothetical protein
MFTARSVTAARPALAALVATLVVLPGTASAQEWAQKMFTVTSHNFGTVAKGSKAEYRFTFRNMYKEDVHVSGIRTSCGCTTPTVSKHLLKTHETSEVLAHFNTDRFLGQKGATLTVTFDKPFFAEVQLRVAGNIRGDMTFEPSFVDFGNVDLGSGVERTIRVTRSGNPQWEIKDVRSANPNFEVQLSEPTRSGSQTRYDLVAKLKPGTPAGYVNGQLILVTNDSVATQIPMDVEGRVVAAVTVSPQLLALGVVQPGASVTKNVVVRANRPFSVTGVVCPDGCLSCEPKGAAATVHILPVTFQAGDASGKVERQLKITTDLGENAVPPVTVQVIVEPGEATAPAVQQSGGRAAAAIGQVSAP